MCAQDESAQLEAESQYRGRLRLGLMFESDPENTNPLLSERKKRRQKGIFHIAIKEAEDLPEMDPVSLTDAVVKCYLLPSRTASNKRKTEVLYMYVQCRLMSTPSTYMYMYVLCRLMSTPSTYMYMYVLCRLMSTPSTYMYMYVLYVHVQTCPLCPCV